MNVSLKRLFLALLLPLYLIGCAQVPRESVELSTTVGRDIEKVHKAHVQTIKILYSRMKDDVNRFIDEVYTPYAIKTSVQKDRARMKNGQLSYIEIISSGLVESAAEEQQKEALGAMELLVKQVNTSVVRERKKLLFPLNEQETLLLNAVNRSYLSIHQANSIVTGHLASVVKVHDAQNEVLNEIGIEADINSFVAENLANTSKEISDLLSKTDEQLDKVGGVEEAKEKLQKIVDKLKINK